jgi:heme/copper-type cytochrome/quinol oxidase subunit 2
MNRNITQWLLVMVLILASQSSVNACPVCYGATDSPMADGVNAAILVLIGITGSVLSGFVAFFVYLRKRSRMTLNGRMNLPSNN